MLWLHGNLQQWLPFVADTPLHQRFASSLMSSVIPMIRYDPRFHSCVNVHSFEHLCRNHVTENAPDSGRLRNRSATQSPDRWTPFHFQESSGHCCFHSGPSSARNHPAMSASHSSSRLEKWPGTKYRLCQTSCQCTVARGFRRRYCFFVYQMVGIMIGCYGGADGMESMPVLLRDGQLCEVAPQC
jgi:hypothetical protein